MKENRLALVLAITFGCSVGLFLDVSDYQGSQQVTAAFAAAMLILALRLK